MCGQKCRNDIHRMHFIQRLDHGKHLHLTGMFQAISGLDLTDSSAASKHLIEALPALLNEFLDRSVASFPHRRNYPPAALQNFEVIGAFYLQLKFVKAVTSEDYMRVRIDKTRTNDAPLRID